MSKIKQAFIESVNEVGAEKFAKSLLMVVYFMAGYVCGVGTWFLFR